MSANAPVKSCATNGSGECSSITGAKRHKTSPELALSLPGKRSLLRPHVIPGHCEVVFDRGSYSALFQDGVGRRISAERTAQSTRNLPRPTSTYFLHHTRCPNPQYESYTKSRQSQLLSPNRLHHSANPIL